MPHRQRLKKRRDDLGRTQAEIARKAGCSEGTIRRYESGSSTPRPADREAVAAAYDWDTARLAWGLDEGAEPLNGHGVPGWLGHLASLEQAAGRVDSWEPFVIHGLAQIADYAFAVERADAVPKSQDAIARRVETRLARQAALLREPGPLELRVVLDESVLRRIAGDATIMAEQLDHLADVADYPNVTVQVLPLAAGRFSAAFGSFTLFTSPGADTPFMACTEDRAGPHYLDRPPELQAHTTLFAHLEETALPPIESMELIRTTAKEYRR